MIYDKLPNIATFNYVFLKMSHLRQFEAVHLKEAIMKNLRLKMTHSKYHR